MRTALALLLASELLLAPAATGAWTDSGRREEGTERNERKKPKKADGGGETPVPPKDDSRQITRLIRDLQFALEGGSARSVLALIERAKFDDYLRFEDMVERLMREDAVRVYFRQDEASPSPAQGKARAVLDAEMELSRKDGAGQVVRRRQQLVLDFEHTRRGWRIVNITPRDYFAPF